MAKNDRLETLNKIGWGKKKEDNQENTSTKNSRLATLSKIGWGNNGVTNDNGLDDAQKAARARTVALRNYENELWKYKNGKAVNKNGLDKTQQAARDRTVWARQPEVQKQLQNRANYLKERNKYQNGDSVEQRGAIDYIQTKGQDAFYNAMLGINQSATAIIPALKAFVQTELDNSKATLRGEDLSDKKNSLQAYKEAFDKSIAEQQGNFSGNFSNEADISPSFENARSNPVVKFIGDQNATMSAQLPNTILGLATSGAGIAPLMANAIGATAVAAKSYPAAFKQATDERADLNTAGNYASKSAAIEGIGEYAIGGAAGMGTGLIDAGVKKFAGKAITNFLGSKPLLHALGKMAAAGAGEGFEEMAQDVLDVYAQRSTYNKNATFDIKDIAYDGLLGAAMGIGFNIPSLPANYVVYKSDYDTVNSLSKAGAAVHNKEDVDTLKTTAKTIADSCTDAIAQLKSQGVSEGVENDISRLEYVRIGAQSVLDSLDKNADTIVSQNAARRKALDNIANNPKEDIVKNLANLVDEVSKGNNSGKNDYKATVDYILSQQAEAKAKYQQAASIEDTETAAKYAADSAAYAEAARQLRNNQKEVQKARASEETYGDVTAEETKTTVAEANTTADEAKTATVETSENAAKASETTEKQETPKEKGDSLRDSILKEHGILGVNKDIDTTADDIVAKYGSYKNAVDKIIEAQKNVREDTTISDEEKQTQISRLQDISRSIRNRNTARQREAIENFSKIVKKYGLEGVEFIDVESDDVRSSPKVNGYYDPTTKKIYVSPYSQDIQTSGSIVVHELTHHGATADHALVNDILKAKDTLVSKGQYSEELFDYSKYETTYKAETEQYINSEDGKTEIATLVKNGMTEEQARAEAAKGYVNEEIAAHFMQEVMSNDDALKRLAKEDRPLLKRILDAIVNFFSGKKHRNERMATLAADKIRSILRATEDVEVDNSRGKKPKATKPMQNIADENAKVGNTSDNRRFSLTRSTEEAGDLIAVHNVTEDKLDKILSADGMPMPSIAVAKADIGHSDFGNISLVFGSETVDPKANRNNKVYSADVWSPTFPSVEYEVNQATESRIVSLYNSIKSKYGNDVAKALYPYYTNLSSELDSKGGAKGIISSLSDDTKMMNVFLADTGETPVKNVVKETSTEMNANTREMGQYLIDTLGKEFVNEANPRDGETAISARNRFLESHEQELRNVLQRYYESNGLDEETAKIVVDATRKGELMSELVKPARSILSGNTTTTSTTIDYEATNEQILDTVDKKQYKEWLNNLFGDAVKNEGIRNGKDPFTPSGNRRSFSATHYPVTLDNIVKAMRGSENVKGATTMTENAKAIRSASAEEYKSIDAIHKNEGRLQKMSESEITAQWDAFDNRLYAIIDSLMDSVPTIDDRLIESRRIGQVIIEASRNPTESHIRSTLEKYSGNGAWYKFNDQTVTDIQSLVNDIREAPTNIFEAKPERVVNLNEIKYAVVPDDLDKDTVQRIADKGIEVRTYESDNEESRLETLNKLDGVRFSKDVDTEADSRYDYSKSFAEQIDDFVNGNFPRNDTLIVSGTPKAFTDIGLNKLPLSYTQTHLKNALANKDGNHLGIDLLKMLPEAIEKPVAIIDSSTNPGKLVAIIEFDGTPGNSIAAVEIDGFGTMNGERIDTNAILSAYTKKNAIKNLLNAAIDSETSGNGGIYYIDKKRASQLLNAIGVQFPGGFNIPNGSVRSITDSKSNVKSKIENVTKTQQFMRWFGKWDTHPETASKVVNEDGTPRIVYHATDYEFYTFDKAKRGENTFRNASDFSIAATSATGFWFSDHDVSGDMGSKKSMQCYLDIKNPYRISLSEMSEEIKAADTNGDVDFDYSIGDFESTRQLSESYVDSLKEQGYDGIIVADSEFGGESYVAFYPNQIKSATDNIGTFDPHNPDIRYSKEIDREYMNAVEAGDMDKVREMIRQAAEEKGFTNAIPEQASSYITRTKAAPKNTIKVYKVFTVAPDGSPTALFVSSTTKLPMNVWLDAVDTYHFKADNGKEYVPSTQNPYTKGGKTGASVTIPNEQVRSELVERGYLSKDSKAAKITALAYRPGWHAGDLPFFPQGGKQGNPRFTNSGNVNKAFNPDIQETAYENIHRYNQVVFECEMAADTDYTEIAQNQEKAKTKSGSVNQRNADLQYMPTDGFYYYTTNPTISDKGKWAISGSLKINRALTQQECDDILSKNGFKPQEWEGGTLDLEKLGYTGETYDAARKTLAPITYDDDGNVIPISERFNKDVKDVRYSKDVFTPEEREKIISKGYTDYLARQFVVKDKSGEHAKAISISARKKLAQQLAKPLKGVNASDALAAITPVFETIEKADGTPEQRAEKAYKAAEKAANTILSMVKEANTNPLYEQYSDLRTYLRTTKLDTSSVKADIADYNEWRKSHMGSMKLGNDGMQIDTAYQELSDMYPEFFPADIVNPADQLIRMGEVSDKLKKVMENPILSQEGSENIVRGFANAILAGYENSAETTLAAKNKQSEEDFARFVTTITRAYETDVRNLSKQLDSSNAKIEKMAESIAKKDETGRRETSRKKALSGVSRLQKAMNEPTLSKNIPESWKKVVETFLKSMGNEDYKNAKKSTHEPKFDPHEALSALAEMQSYVNDFQNSKESTIRMSADQIKNLEWQISGIRASLEDYIHDNKDNLNAKDISLVTSQDANWLANIADLTQTINHLIKQENELFVGKKKMDAEQFASELIDQINERKRKFQKTGEEDSDIKKWITNSQFDYVAPDIYLHMLGERGDDLANAYRLGQDKISANKQKYVDAIKELVGENFSAEKSSIRGELIDVKINGDAMKVSRQQLMSMYVLWYRPQARQHMETGGVFFLNRNGEPQGKPVVITQSIFNDLAKNLTKDDIRIANGIRNFLSTECAEWGNEASMEMYGYKKFNDPNYFPINVHGDTLAYNVGKAPDSNVLERKGFTKKVDPNSIKPIDIRDIFDVADKHVEDMTMYAGYAPINSTTLRIYNAPGVKSSIREQYGNNAVRYMERFLYKANGLANENNTASPKLYYWNKLANAGKKAAVAFNISTAAKQPLSYFRAGIELDTKYLVNAWSDVLPKKKYDALLQEMNENSGIAKIKSLGYSDVGMGHDTRSQYSDQTFKGAYKKGEYIKNKFEDASMYLAGKADERTWVRIWDACKMKVEAENGKLTHQELMSLTTEKFNQVIGRTQVVDSLMDTAPIAYDPKFKAFFPFSNEPIKTMATLYYTWNDMKKGKGKEGFTKAVSSIVLTNLILEPLVSSMMGVWRDKEDEDPLTYIEKVIEHWTGLGIGEDSETSFTSIITSEMVDGVFVDPILSGLFEIFTDIIQGYSGDVMNSSGLYDLGESSKRLLNAIMKGEDYKGEKSTYNLTMEFIASVAQILGIPANTLRRDTNAAIRTVLYYAQNVIPASNIARWELNKLYYNLGNKSARTEKYFYDILIDAYNQEDKTAYNIMREDLDEMGIQSKEVVEIIEKRNGAIKPGSSVWNTEVQARFDLPTKSTGNKVEQMVTRVYTACQKIDTLDENKALPKRPDKYYYTNDDGDKVEMTTQEYEKFVEDVGVLRYKLCAEMAASNGWNKLNAEQQLYALTKAYDFAARYYRQKFNKDYNSGDTWMKELYGTQFRNKEVASTIISKAFKK